eukprot:TRINITY_DN37664_c0_g2_i1.p1 TRINITY_DN37664_c0_g2~~TRINITY_DN37664_c0_g2_i1.p1  ORF type:complete len:809 (-),score=112.47 TRINITY_DN37664_c0_g2_i1:120-2546(-)
MMARVAYAFSSLWFQEVVDGSPNHDTIRRLSPITQAPQWYEGAVPPFDAEIASRSDRDDSDALRRLALASPCEVVVAGAQGWKPLNLGIEFVDMDADLGPRGASAKRRYLEDVLVPEAVAFWQRALQVRRLKAPLLVPRPLAKCIRFETEAVCTPMVAEAATCGVDGVVVPEKYLAGARICPKRCAPRFEHCTRDCLVEGKCACSWAEWDEQKDDYCCKGFIAPRGCPESCTIETVNRSTGVCEECVELPQGDGAIGKDLVLFITSKQTDHCERDTLGYAVNCAEDQCNRPVFGHLNFCPSAFTDVVSDTLADRWVHARHLSTAMHEMAHVLGFSSANFVKFRTPSGAPRLPRKTSGASHFKDVVWWTCDYDEEEVDLWDDYENGMHPFVDPVGVIKALPATGSDSCPCPLGKPKGTQPDEGCLKKVVNGFRLPTCTYLMVTPKVVDKARSHFACSTLVGAELENQPTSPCSMYGSHWEQRIFMYDLMSSSHVIGIPVVSEVTLAVFEDSGWYLPNYSFAAPLRQGHDWGFGQGCDFVNGKCVVNGVSRFPDIFCTDKKSSSCSADLLSAMGCSLLEVGSAVPPAVAYFGSDRRTGRTAPADYCPIFATPLGNRRCTDALKATTFPVSNANVMREVFGDSSRCHIGNLRGDIAMSGFVPVRADTEAMASYLGSNFDGVVAQCFHTVCHADGTSYELFIANHKEGEEERPIRLGRCTAYGQRLNAQAPLKGSVLCQGPYHVCRGPRTYFPDDGFTNARAPAEPVWRATSTITMDASNTTFQANTGLITSIFQPFLIIPVLHVSSSNSVQ